MRAVLAALFFALGACAHAVPEKTLDVEQASSALEAVVAARAEELQIPGIAYAVVRDGAILSEGEVTTDGGPALTPDTPLRFASVTKAFTAVLLMRAVEQGKLSLDDSVSRWNGDFSDRPQITLRHIAAHVSEGEVGREYVYSTTRYSKLGDILAQAYGARSYEDALRRELIAPLGMTWRESPHLGAHAGLVASVRDLSRFVAALQTNEVISERSFLTMTTPYRGPNGLSPVGVGWFSQTIAGEPVVWSFGQDDPDHSSALVLLLPKRNIALIMLANTDELSNPFRLMMGDISKSPFATAFLDAFAPEVGIGVTARDRAISDLLISINREDMAKASVQFAGLDTGETPTDPDMVLHFAAGIVAREETSAFARQLDSVVIQHHPANRWALLLSGGMHARLGETTLATQRYGKLLALQNQEQDGLRTLFRAWAYQGLAALHIDDAARARTYIEEGLATGVTGGTRDGLLALRGKVAQP
ncbi:MAG: serine hydrolase domain-containing protein [Hyphomonadaceae bacterium]|nr:serine hydrolase domain-containing protein [Hyphomonadaceae bacterium]